LQRKEYSAGAVKLSFWFHEFRKAVLLIRSGKTLSEIKTLAERENIFSAATPMRSRQIFSTIASRMSSLDESWFANIEESTLETQKLIVLISIMFTDTLFFDFMNEVYREKLITGDALLTDTDVRVFFLDKQRESEKVAGWRDETLVRLRKCYKTYLVEAGLLERGVGDRKIIKPLVDSRLTEMLSDDKLKPVLNILTGAR
jgi:hypothetical protein